MIYMNIDNNFIFLIINIIVLIVSYLVGRFLVPKVINQQLDTLNYVSQWAYKFVVAAENLFKNHSGSEKKEYVVAQIQILLKTIGIKMSDEQISALIEDAYEQMKNGEEDATKAQGTVKLEVVNQDTIKHDNDMIINDITSSENIIDNDKEKEKD